MNTYNNAFRKLYRVFVKPTTCKFFLYLFFINIISNIVSVKYNNDALSIIQIISLSAIIAYAESAIYIALKSDWIRKLYASIIIAIHNILATTEYFILINFQMDLNQDVIDIICDTNSIEASNFLATYLQPHAILLYLICLIGANIALLLLIRFISRIKYEAIALSLAFIGLFISTAGTYSFIKYRNGMNIPQLTTLTRLGYSLYCAHQRVEETNQIRLVCENLNVKQNIKHKPNIIVVIGESFSVYHSSLYGYEKDTNPLLRKKLDNGSLSIFDNAVTAEPATSVTMSAVFSLDSLGIGYTTMPMFPACFKKAGYKTELFDNQYFVGQGISFLTDKKLSTVMFDKRNTKRYKYDEEMVQAIKTEQQPTLYVIHLWGQHYTYKDRFPQEFSKFTANLKLK